MTTEKGKRASRQRWSTKKKAQVLTVMTMVFLIVVIMLLPHAFAHTDEYYIGYSQGKTQAITDYYAYANDYRPFCPVYDAWTAAHGLHSSNFCAGFIDGYNAQWNAIAHTTRSVHDSSLKGVFDTYKQGDTDGRQYAKDTFNSGGQYDSKCPSGHSDIYCTGYFVGYNYEWTLLKAANS
jgi:hypothetical protein